MDPGQTHEATKRAALYTHNGGHPIVRARHVVTLPDNAPFDLGAALGVPFVTAHRCLTVAESGPSRLGHETLSGRTILVHGGAGAGDTAAIRLARRSDATVLN
jgi:NADPH:quinone reductase